MRRLRNAVRRHMRIGRVPPGEGFAEVEVVDHRGVVWGGGGVLAGISVERLLEGALEDLRDAVGGSHGRPNHGHDEHEALMLGCMGPSAPPLRCVLPARPRKRNAARCEGLGV